MYKRVSGIDQYHYDLVSKSAPEGMKTMLCYATSAHEHIGI